MKGGVLRDGSKVKDIRLGRIAPKTIDPRNANFPLRDLLGWKTKPVTREWDLDADYQQGEEGTCTATACGHMLAAEPLRITHVSTPEDGLQPLTYAWLRKNIYFNAQLIDGYPGGASPAAGRWAEGTDIVSTMRIAKRWDLITAYHWATTFDELLLGLSYVGPAFIGIPWFRGFFELDAKGIIRLVGHKSGYHAITLIEVDMENKWVVGKQSWEDWGFADEKGRPGRFRIKFPVMEKMAGRKNTEMGFATKK